MREALAIIISFSMALSEVLSAHVARRMVAFLGI